jgi:hypothetical protein
VSTLNNSRTPERIIKTFDIGKLANVCRDIQIFLLEDYRLLVERRFARSVDPKIYADGRISPW